MKNSESFTFLTGLTMASLVAARLRRRQETKDPPRSPTRSLPGLRASGTASPYLQWSQADGRPFKWSGKIAEGRPSSAGDQWSDRAVASNGSRPSLSPSAPAVARTRVGEDRGGSARRRCDGLRPLSQQGRVPSQRLQAGGAANVPQQRRQRRVRASGPQGRSVRGRTVNGSIRAEVDGQAAVSTMAASKSPRAL
jgi:hypothetical protein